MSPSLRDLMGQNEFWIFVFASGWLLLNWPLINLAEGFFWRGTPAILIYIASVWLIIIGLLFLFDLGGSR